MAVSRQDPVVGNGRVNQKLRTRSAIVAAAQELQDEGVVPTVAAAAERALVSRATAYRYFPTQESLLLDLAVTVDVSDLEELVAQPVDADSAATRAVQLVELFNRKVLDDEARYRTAIRVYLDLWLSAARDGRPAPVLRAGRRTRWIGDTLRPLPGRRTARQQRRLEAALAMVMGMEAMVVLRDICQLEPEEAVEVSTAAAAAILQHLA